MTESLPSRRRRRRARRSGQSEQTAKPNDSTERSEGGRPNESGRPNDSTERSEGGRPNESGRPRPRARSSGGSASASTSTSIEGAVRDGATDGAASRSGRADRTASPGSQAKPRRRTANRPAEDTPSKDTDRSWRELLGNAPSQVGVSGAMRARDVARPGAEELTAAERALVIVRRQWKPPEETGHPPRGTGH